MSSTQSPRSPLLSLEAARQQILAAMPTLQDYQVVDLRNALNRILAAPIHAPLNTPPYDQSAMDGYALHHDDPHLLNPQWQWPIAGTSWAGTPFTADCPAGHCVRVMTGAALPPQTDTVIMQEYIERQENHIILKIKKPPQKGDNVRYCGEDIAKDSLVLTPGQRLLPPQIGLLASLGIAEVKVWRKLRVAFFSTGDELRPLATELQPGQIYDSNRYALHALLSRLPIDLFDLGVIPDQPALIEAALQQAATLADIIITSGGVSVGDADYVKSTLERLGEIQFWKIAMKPGKPLAFGHLGKAWFFGLPGNPVSTMITFYQLVQPALYQAMGTQPILPLRLQAICTTPLDKTPGRLDFQRGILETNPQGQYSVRTTGLQSSGALSSMNQANCLIVLPADWGSVAAGTLVEVEPLITLV